MKDHPMSVEPHSNDSSFEAAVAKAQFASNLTSASGWIPRPWQDELMGCVFLPRMLQKGRRVLEGERLGRDLMNGFLFGDFDYADGMILRFLRTKEVRVRELLRDHNDDETVAAILFREGRRSPGEIAKWSRYFRRVNAPFTPMWDADEGRREPGLGTSLLKGFYNHLMMPVVYLAFGWMTARRRRLQIAPRAAVVQTTWRS